jgi:hypothetical protein
MVLLCSPPLRTAGAAAAFAGVGAVAGVDLPQNILGATAHADQPNPFVRLMHCGIREGMQPTIGDRALSICDSACGDDMCLASLMIRLASLEAWIVPIEFCKLSI